MLDDWRLEQDATLAGNFGAMFDRAHGGRIGNWVTVNGIGEWRQALPQGARVRLRLINGANARIFDLTLRGFTAYIVALDGQPVPVPRLADRVTLAPAQRVDLIADVVGAAGDEALILSAERDGAFALASFQIEEGSAPRTEPPPPLDPNPVLRLASLPDVPVAPLRMEGGAMGGMRDAMANGRMQDGRSLAGQGLVWALNGMAGMPQEPFAEIATGTPVRISLINDTAWPHGMHLHGHHFHEVVDGLPGPLRDTTLVAPQGQNEIAFIADNPGDWLLHCHMLEHADSGMMTWIRVT
jgi:FtsP/CotA-like multicopper oxidase with cupredoxin domain